MESLISSLCLAITYHVFKEALKDDGRIEEAKANLSVLLERAFQVTGTFVQEAIPSQGEDKADSHGSDEEASEDSCDDLDTTINANMNSPISSLLRVLNLRTRLLMDLCPTIEHITTSIEYGSRPKDKRIPLVFHVSDAAQQWVRQILDRFELADSSLAERLGEANWQRYNKLRGQKDGDTQTEEPKSVFHPLRDSALGTSILTPTQNSLSSASHSSFASSIAEQGVRRVPKTPDAVSTGAPFVCEICGNTVTNVRNRTQWK